jgi:hypothetical protein
MDSPNYLSFTYNRRFGVEMEMNSLDKRDFQIHPLDSSKHESPKGIDYIANLILKETGYSVSVERWHPTHNNSEWILKPDRSCGIELCSPAVKGWPGLKNICEVADVIKRDDKISIDHRCSLHVHIEVADCTREEIAKILTYWIKCESVFLDSVPNHRKRNQYCQCIGMTDLFEHNTIWDEDLIIKKLGNQKYYTINCFHYHKGLTTSKPGRKTIEIRIGESEACSDPFLIKNWVRLLLHFVERAKAAEIPGVYNSNNSMSGFCWLDPDDVMKFLGFTEENQLSKGMEQTRNWFIARLYNNISKDDSLPGVWSNLARKIAREQLTSIIDNLGLNVSDMDSYLNPNNPELLYSGEYKN